MIENVPGEPLSRARVEYVVLWAISCVAISAIVGLLFALAAPGKGEGVFYIFPLLFVGPASVASAILSAVVNRERPGPTQLLRSTTALGFGASVIASGALPLVCVPLGMLFVVFGWAQILEVLTERTALAARYGLALILTCLMCAFALVSLGRQPTRVIAGLGEVLVISLTIMGALPPPNRDDH
jgi:hypothetical protein